VKKKKIVKPKKIKKIVKIKKITKPKKVKKVKKIILLNESKNIIFKIIWFFFKKLYF